MEQWKVTVLRLQSLSLSLSVQIANIYLLTVQIVCKYIYCCELGETDLRSKYIVRRCQFPLFTSTGVPVRDL